MTTFGIDVQRCRHIVAVEFRVIVKAIGGRYGLVVIAQGNKGTRGRTVHTDVVAIFSLQFPHFLLGTVLTQEVVM